MHMELDKLSDLNRECVTNLDPAALLEETSLQREFGPSREKVWTNWTNIPGPL